jgi:hypothetical protein
LTVARQLDDNDSDVHRILAACALIRRRSRQPRGSISSARSSSTRTTTHRRAARRDPHLAGPCGEGIDWIKLAMRLNPFPSGALLEPSRRAHYRRALPRAVDAYRRLSKADHRAARVSSRRRTRSSGEPTAPARHAQEVRRLIPDFSAARHVASLHYREEANREHLREALRRRGCRIDWHQYCVSLTEPRRHDMFDAARMAFVALLAAATAASAQAPARTTDPCPLQRPRKAGPLPGNGKDSNPEAARESSAATTARSAENRASPAPRGTTGHRRKSAVGASANPTPDGSGNKSFFESRSNHQPAHE